MGKSRTAAYVDIVAQGDHLERFLSICSYRGIVFHKIKRIDPDKMEFQMRAVDYIRCHAAIRKTGTRTAIRKKTGLPFLFARWKKQMIFSVGFVVLFLFLILQFGRLWRIEIRGNNRLSEEQITNVLKENGVSFGIRLRHMNLHGLEELLRTSIEDINWASCSVEGTTLIVHITERLPLSGQVLKEGNLVAPFDGMIESIVTRKGIPRVKAGQTVTKGDILVCGEWVQYNDDMSVRDVTPLHADADVYIRHKQSVCITLPLNYTVKEYTGVSYRHAQWKIYDLLIELPHKRSKSSKTDTYTVTKQWKCLGKFYLPVWNTTVITREYEPVEKTYSLQEASDILHEKLDDFLSGLEEKGVQIIEKDVNIELNGNVYMLSGSIELIENIYERVDTGS